MIAIRQPIDFSNIELNAIHADVPAPKAIEPEVKTLNWKNTTLVSAGDVFAIISEEMNGRISSMFLMLMDQKAN